MGIYHILIIASFPSPSGFCWLEGICVQIPALHDMHSHSQTWRRLLNQQPPAVLVLGGLALSQCAAWETPDYCVAWSDGQPHALLHL